MLTPPAGAVVFDLDGVLIDSRGPVRAAASAALAECGVEARPDEALDRLIGPPAGRGFAELIGAAEGSTLVLACIDAYHRHYGAVALELTALVEGVDEMLAQLPQPLALATAKVADFVEPLLAAFAIAERFRVVCAPAMAAPDEPKTAILARALEALGACDAVMIGDRCFDVEAAHANGIRAIGVTWGIGDRAELELAGAEVIVERPSELVALLTPAGAPRARG